MQERKTNLDVLDPLGEKQGACALSNGVDVGVDGTNNADTSVSGERRLKHPGKLGVAVGDMVAVMVR